MLTALTTADNPATVLSWLGKSRSARLLGRLAKAGQPLALDLLDELPQTNSLHYIRELLGSAGVLQARNEHLERLEPWLDPLLRGKPAHHVRLVRPFAHWLHWAHTRGLAGDLAVPLRPWPEPVRLLAGDDHVRQLDRCLTDEAMPLDLRVGGALALLSGILVSRLMRLTRNDVIDDGQHAYLNIDGHRLMLPSTCSSAPGSSATASTPTPAATPPGWRLPQNSRLQSWPI